MNGDTAINILTNHYEPRWAKQTNTPEMKKHWLGVLLEECEELTDAVYECHEHPIELELIQIGSIVHNWLNRCDPNDIEKAMRIYKEKHGNIL